MGRQEYLLEVPTVELTLFYTCEHMDAHMCVHTHTPFKKLLIKLEMYAEKKYVNPKCIA